MAIRSVHIDTARTWRGGQNQVLLTVTGLEGLGHPAVLVAHARGELRRRAAEGLRFVGLAPRSEMDVRAGWQLGRILADVEPDVVHAHDPMAVALAAMALRMRPKSRRRPLVVASRRVDFHLRRHAFSRWKYRHVDVFLAASDAIGALLRRDGVPAGRIVTVHDGIDVGAIDRQPPVDAHAEFWIPRGAPVVGNVAALVPHKGQTHLIGAAAEVLRTHPDARFLILGEGELRPALERKIQDLGLESRVVLGGFRADAVGLIKSFDVFAMSSVTEGLGSVLLEAMACGRAVAATSAGGIPEAVEDGGTGLLVPPRDERALAGAIGRLLGDADLCAALGAAGRRRVDAHFSAEAMVKKVLAVYQDRLAAAR